MRARRFSIPLAGAAVALSLAAGTAFASPQATTAPVTPGVHLRAACGAAAAPRARCFALAQADATGALVTSATPGGYGPKDLQAAYKLPSSTKGLGQTVAIVDAYDNPKAESDLARYRSTFGLPPCTTANGCFRKVNQSGASSPLPAANVGWGQEIALDLDMVSAACPKCHILLVEATDSYLNNLAAAVDTAARLKAKAISNSYGAPEFGGETTYESHYNHPGSAITVSTGDSGYGVQFPSASRYVTAVGGTSLRRSSSARGWSESAWSGAGSGCSSQVPKPAWQHDTGCSRRTVADVSAVADPNTGVAVYDTYGSPGWMVFGGTSASSPIIASVYALAGNTASTVAGSYPYAHGTGLFDVVTGSTGSCGGSYLCTAKVGFDGPTGLGTPKGTTAF